MSKIEDRQKGPRNEPVRPVEPLLRRSCHQAHTHSVPVSYPSGKDFNSPSSILLLTFARVDLNLP